MTLKSLFHRKIDVAHMKARRNIPGLLRALEEPETNGRAREALKDLLPREAVEPLITLLSRKNPLCGSHSIVELLGLLGDTRAYEPLVAALGNREIAAEAAEALGRLGDRRAVEPLLEALRSPASLWNLKDRAAEALAEFGELRALDLLIDVLGEYRSGSGRTGVQTAFQRLAGTAPDAVIGALSRALESDQERRRWSAVEVLAILGDKAIDVLLAAVGNSDGSVRRKASEALLQRKDPRLRGRIEEVLSQGKMDTNLLIDYEALGGDLFAPLSAAVNGTDWARLNAARMLVKCGHRAAALLEGLLKDENCDVRNAAIESLIRLGCIESLVPALLEERTSFFVQEALLRAKHPAAPALLFPLFVDRDSPARRPAAVILCENAAAGRMGNLDKSQLMEAMIDVLQDPDDNMRSTAAETLGWLRDLRAIRPLEAFMADDHNLSNLRLKSRGVEALQRIKETSAALSPETPVDRLMAIYRQNPQGFVSGSAHPLVTEIHAIGSAFDASGGMDAMRTAHAEFVSKCNVRGAARNLEFLWDGIGDWRG